jgi:AcrR family transcriptional regulator/predicted DNA-binding transcriptional regulator AlpA
MTSDTHNVQEGSMELFTMRQLSQLAGMPRSTIQFYLREEILPQPQRFPNGRPIYGRIHAELLGQIKRLKAEGKSLEEIRLALRDRGRSATFYQVDAAKAIENATKARILEAAADQFGQNGYNRTRLSDVIKQAGVTPQVLASHFPSKKELFAQSFGIVSRRVAQTAIPAMELESDVRRKLLARFENLLRSRMPDPSLWALARSEALYEGGEPAANAQRVYQKMSSLHVTELAQLRQKHENGMPHVSDELMAYCFLGAEEYLIMRLGWDDSFSVEDALWAYLLLISAVHSAYERGSNSDDWTDVIRGLGE